MGDGRLGLARTRIRLDEDDGWTLRNLEIFHSFLHRPRRVDPDRGKPAPFRTASTPWIDQKPDLVEGANRLRACEGPAVLLETLGIGKEASVGADPVRKHHDAGEGMGERWPDLEAGLAFKGRLDGGEPVLEIFAELSFEFGGVGR